MRREEANGRRERGNIVRYDIIYLILSLSLSSSISLGVPGYELTYVSSITS